MTEAAVALASAVIIPEAEAVTSSEPQTLKRRQPSTEPPEPKRQRVDDDAPSKSPNPVSEHMNNSSKPSNADRQRNGRLEERKRGKRLFGALLGTLAQSSSSSSATSRRRADIDKKQQEKLRAQTAEEDERMREELEALTAKRRIEQRVYDECSKSIERANKLARAHYLKTEAAPVLYYRPWELLPEQEKAIEDQVREANGAGAGTKDVSSANAEDTTARPDDERPAENINDKEMPDATNGAEERIREQSSRTREDTAETMTVEATYTKDESTNPQKAEDETGKDQGDDADEVVEGDEDNVLY